MDQSDAKEPPETLNLPNTISFPIWNVIENRRAFLYIGRHKIEVFACVDYDFDSSRLVCKFNIEKRICDQVTLSVMRKIRISGYCLSKIFLISVGPSKSNPKLSEITVSLERLRTSKDASIDAFVFPIINAKRSMGDSALTCDGIHYSNGRTETNIDDFNILVDNTPGICKSNNTLDLYQLTSIVKLTQNGNKFRATNALRMRENTSWIFTFSAGHPVHAGIVWGYRGGKIVYFDIQSVVVEKYQDIQNWATWINMSDILSLLKFYCEIKDKNRARNAKILISLYCDMQKSNTLSRPIIDLATICEITSKIAFSGLMFNRAIREEIVPIYNISTNIPSLFADLSIYIGYMSINRSWEKHYWRDLPSTYAGIRNMQLHGEINAIFSNKPSSRSAIHQLDQMAIYYAQIIILNFIGYSGKIYDILNNLTTGQSGFVRIN